MMEYERLTKRTERGKVYADECFGCADGVDCLNCPINESVWKRLAELEDKIEQGTLIEIPTQEFVFHISKSKNGNYVVREISKYYYMSVYACTDGIMNKWFSTREEAEKRLKELQNGR